MLLPVLATSIGRYVILAEQRIEIKVQQVMNGAFEFHGWSGYKTPRSRSILQRFHHFAIFFGYQPNKVGVNLAHFGKGRVIEVLLG